MTFRIFAHPSLLMRGLSGTRTEIGLATMAYNHQAHDQRPRRCPGNIRPQHAPPVVPLNYLRTFRIDEVLLVIKPAHSQPATAV
jgi:hypothetical protein